MHIRVLLRFPQVLYGLSALREAQTQLNDKGLQWLEEQVNVTYEDEITDLPDRKIANLEFAARWHESIRLAARLPLWKKEKVPACLPKALALHTILLARDLRPGLSLGVSKRDRQFASHAWVELHGQMIGEPDNVAEEFVKVNARAWSRQATK
jgi:hypothetical protein